MIEAGSRMPKVLASFIVAAAVMCVLPREASGQTSHLLIIVGLAGDPEHAELFRKWASKLADTATGPLGVQKANVTVLTDAENLEGTGASGRSTREEVIKAFG